MRQVDNLSDEAVQATKVLLDDGSILTLTLRYMPTVQRRTVDVSHTDLTVNGVNLCNHPNILRQWRQNIQFGIACLAADGVDPVYIDDFLNGRVNIFVLNASDVAGIEANVMGPPA